VESVKTVSLVRIEDTDLTVADPKEDIRGRKVTDASGEEIGKVKSLFVDQEEQEVRLSELERGGFLGLATEMRLIPLDAIEKVTEHEVRVGTTRDHVHAAPIYDPQVTYDARYYEDLYGYYGYAPYWAAGPPYPPQSRRR
jgi:sporulation protein YlmC with PRC-barrel domain